jgi:hypothetical protein
VRFLRRLILLAALAAGAAYLKQLFDEQQDHAQPQGEASPVAPSTAQFAATGSAGNGSGGATKAELYEQAQRLGIEGRSKMTKSELERAIRAAG